MPFDELLEDYDSFITLLLLLIDGTCMILKIKTQQVLIRLLFLLQFLMKLNHLFLKVLQVCMTTLVSITSVSHHITHHITHFSTKSNYNGSHIMKIGNNSRGCSLNILLLLHILYLILPHKFMFINFYISLQLQKKMVVSLNFLKTKNPSLNLLKTTISFLC